MIIGAYLRNAAPDHPAGAEWTIFDLFTWLTQRGHDCRVMAENGYVRERVPSGLIYSNPSDDEVAAHFRECDVMLTQLDATMQAQLLAAAYQTPLVQFIHSATQLDNLGVMESCSALVVFNSKHVAHDCQWWDGESMVLHPPVDADRVRVEKPGRCATLVNLSASKGGAVFWKLAQENEWLFCLGVMGAYDQQVIQTDGLALHSENESTTGLPPNMRIMGELRNIRDAFAYTRVLLVLSHTETYGRIAAEAMVSGIPVISVSTHGLHEAIGTAAHWIKDRGHTREIRKLLVQAYDDVIWQSWSAGALEQWTYLNQRQQMELRIFERELLRIHAAKPEMTL